MTRLARILPLLAVCGALLCGPAAAQCSVSASSVNFGSIDVLANTVFDTTGTITVTCQASGGPPDRNYTVCVSIGAGPLGDATSRVMSGAGGASTLRYEFYKDAARTVKWGSWATGYAGTGQQILVMYGATDTLTVYARVFAGQQTARAVSHSTSHADLHWTWAYNTSSPCPTGSSPSTGSFNVSASVTPKCNVTASGLGFGTFGNFSSIRDGETTIGAQCNTNLPYSIALNGGTANASDPTQRKMALGGNQVTYGLYRNAARSSPWGSTTGTNTQAGTGTGAWQNFTVYGRIPVQTTPPAGTYADTIVATITY
jgi:spore coat protein U-like protein